MGKLEGRTMSRGREEREKVGEREVERERKLTIEELGKNVKM